MTLKVISTVLNEENAEFGCSYVIISIYWIVSSVNTTKTTDY